MIVKIETSARHIHLKEADFKACFGAEAQLAKEFDLGQSGEFASNQRLKILGANGRFLEARIIGPYRPQTQVEISISDAKILGLAPHLCLSGQLAGSGSVTLEGPLGKIKLKEGLIIAKRHLHLDPATAAAWGLSEGQSVSARLEGERGLTFDNIIVRLKENHHPAIHIDTDEANAAGLTKSTDAELVI
ncbi:MAG: PduL/EutD family phosphate acyltransferase [Candidatus Falkowbacteria bacterium]